MERKTLIVLSKFLDFILILPYIAFSLFIIAVASQNMTHKVFPRGLVGLAVLAAIIGMFIVAIIILIKMIKFLFPKKDKEIEARQARLFCRIFSLIFLLTSLGAIMAFPHKEFGGWCTLFTLPPFYLFLIGNILFIYIGWFEKSWFKKET